jgi:uncharacterized FlaG/YvyC family protein
MANQLDLNELLNRSVANVVGGNDQAQEATNESDLNIDLEGQEEEQTQEQEVQSTTSDLNLDLESIEDQVHYEMDETVMTKLKAALGAGVATNAVLEARQLARYEESQTTQE